MTGQYDALHLAGVAMATSLWSPFFTFLTGIVSALVPIIGHHLGAGRKDRVAPDFYQFLYMALGYHLSFCPRFSRGTLGFESFRFGAFGQKGRSWLPTLSKSWDYPPSTL